MGFVLYLASAVDLFKGHKEDELANSGIIFIVGEVLYSSSSLYLFPPPLLNESLTNQLEIEYCCCINTCCLVVDIWAREGFISLGDNGALSFLYWYYNRQYPSLHFPSFFSLIPFQKYSSFYILMLQIYHAVAYCERP